MLLNLSRRRCVQDDRLSAIDAITRIGALSNLQVCLDAGDSVSLPAASTKWLDRSGGGYDFFRGTTAGAEGTDPSINGTAGGLSANEYLGFDGGDLCQYDTTNETWIQNFHKDNALYTLGCWVYPGAIGSNMGLFGTSGNNANNIGVDWQISTTGVSTLRVANGSGSNAAQMSGAGAGLLNAAAWNFCAFSVNEAAGTAVAFLNGNSSSPSSTYTSPSASNASFTAQIGTRGNAALPLVNGSRMAAFMAWEGIALTLAQLEDLYAALRPRFGV